MPNTKVNMTQSSIFTRLLCYFKAHSIRRKSKEQNTIIISLLLISFFYASTNGRGSVSVQSAQKANNVIKVGPGRDFQTPSAAARAVRDGSIVEIEPGVYANDAAVWTQNNLIIRGINRPHIAANGSHVEGKGTWVVKGNNIQIENIEFSGSRVPDGNGAAIRFEGTSIAIRNCFFHDNQNGFLCGKNSQSDVIIENCEFAENGAGDGRTHNVYVGNVNSCTIQFSYIHHAYGGHNIKSRSKTNYILYNRIMDEAAGASSFAIDLPNGGQSFVIGNAIQQGPETENSNILSYGGEGLQYEKNQLYVINNSFVNDRHYGVFLKIAEGTPVARVINNIFYGNGEMLSGQATVLSNLMIPKKKTLFFDTNKPGFVDAENYDYRLKPKASAINNGIDPGKVDGFYLAPIAQYIHPQTGQKRVTIQKIDIGAYEYMSLDGQ